MSVSAIQSTTRLVLFLTVADTDLTKDEIDVQLTSTTIKTTARGKVVMNGTFFAPVVTGTKSFGTQQVPGGSSVYVSLDKEKSEIWDQIFTTAETKIGSLLVSKYQMVATNPSSREDDNELEFDTGDVIEVTDEDPSGWNFGVCNGFYGMFPGNFCKKIVEYIGDYRVIVAYAKQEDNELELKVGDIVKVISQDESGWWEGELNGATGWFPSNFVESAKEPKEQPTAPQSQQPQTPQQSASTSSPAMPTRQMPSSRPPNAGLKSQPTPKPAMLKSSGDRLHVARKAKGPARRHAASRGKKLGEDVKTWTETDKAPGNQSGTSPAANARRLLNPMGGMADVTNQLKMQLGKKPSGPLPGRNVGGPHANQPGGSLTRSGGLPHGPQQRPVQGKLGGGQQSSSTSSPPPTKLPPIPVAGQQALQQPVKLPMPQQGRAMPALQTHAQRTPVSQRPEQGQANAPSGQGSKPANASYPSTPMPGRGDTSSLSRVKQSNVPYPASPMPGREQGKPSPQQQSQPQSQQQRSSSGVPQQPNEKYKKILAQLNEKIPMAKFDGEVAQEFKPIQRPVFAIRSTDGHFQHESAVQRIIIGEGIGFPLLAYLMKNGVQCKQTEFSLGTTEGILLLVKDFILSESQREKSSDPFVLLQGFQNFFTQSCKCPVGIDLCIYEKLKETQLEVRGRAFEIGSRFPPFLLQQVLDCYFLLTSYALTPIALATFLCSCPPNVRGAYLQHSLVKGEFVSFCTLSGIVAFALPEASFVVCDSHLCGSREQSTKTQKMLSIADTAIAIAKC